MSRSPAIRLAGSEEEDGGVWRGDVASLFETHSEYVARVALRLLGRDSELDDVVQDVFVEAMRGVGQVRAAAAIRGWLATITVRVTSKRLRRRRLWITLGFDDAGGEVPVVAASQDVRTLVGEVYAILDKAPVAERLAWVLRHVEGCSLQEVADCCQCSLATAKRRISSAEAWISKGVGK